MIWGHPAGELDLQANALCEFGASTSDYSVNSGWGALGVLSYLWKLDSEDVNSIGASFRYEELWQNTSLIQRTEAQSGLKFFFTRRIGQ